MEGCHVVVIGGGPGGLLAAAHLAFEGAHVTVYERDTAEEQSKSSLGWTIALGRVAKEAIDGAYISSDFGPACKIEGASIQSGLSEPRFLGKWAPEAGKVKGGMAYLLRSLASFDAFTYRETIIEHLRREISENLEDVTFRDGMTLVGGDLRKGEVVLEKVTAGSNGSSKDRVTVHADMVIGADGAGSRTRHVLEELDPEFKAERVYATVSNQSFNLLLPATAAEREKILSDTPSGSTFMMTPPSYEVRSDGGAFISAQGPAKGLRKPDIRMLTLHFRSGGTKGTGMMTCSTKWWQSQESEEEILETLKACFPQIPIPWLQSCAAAGISKSTDHALRISSFVKCSKLGSGRCVLIGDAAHSVSPNVAAGATNAMHDAALLAPCALDLVMLPPQLRPIVSFQSSKSLSDVLLGAKKQTVEASGSGFERLASIAEEWTLLRLDDAHALSNMSEQLNNGLLFKLHKDLGQFLRAMPVYVPWALSTMPLPGKRFLIPILPQDALINGGASPGKIQQTLYRSFYRLAAVAGVSCALLAGAGIHLMRSRRS